MTDLGPTRLVLVGCGKMGGAMLRGWLGRSLAPDRCLVVEPKPVGLESLGVAHVAAAAGIPASFVADVVVLAVKPQMMEAALPGYARFAGAGTLFLSIAAGKTIAYLQARLAQGTAVVRAMPNTPAAIGRGISVAVASPQVTAVQRSLSDALLSACGEVAWVEEEGLIDAVTAVSGGGPAYVFLLMEALSEAGRKAGLPAALAQRLARVTVQGAGELARLSPESPAELRQAVTSPKGTTLEALNILMAKDGLQPLFDRAIAAATRRARELAAES